MVKFGWNPPMFQSKEERVAAAAGRGRAPGRTRRGQGHDAAGGVGAGDAAPSRPPTKRTNATNPKAKTTRR